MRALDLFCGAGGVSMGLRRAGFEVVGVDIKPQPRYPFEFHQADAMTYPLNGFDFIWASPPCQAYSSLQNLGKQGNRPRFHLVDPIRERLQASGVPYVIENVPGAPLRQPFMLCGQYFGLKVRRHRVFESSFMLLVPECHVHHEPEPIAVYGDHPEKSRRNPRGGGYINRAHSLEMGREAMGIDWMEWRELTQAIPPAYSEFIAKAFMQSSHDSMSHDATPLRYTPAGGVAGS